MQALIQKLLVTVVLHSAAFYDDYAHQGQRPLRDEKTSFLCFPPLKDSPEKKKLKIKY